MRRIAILAVLLATIASGHANVAGAESAAEPAVAPAISAICAYEFADAAEDAALTPPVATPEGDEATAVEPIAMPTGAPTAVPAEAPSAAPGGPASEPPEASVTVPTSDALDGAVRGCASVAEWLTAAQLYPAALGPADAQAALAQRCGDPTAGLERYATCQSLAAAVEAALATPEPTAPTPTAAPPDPEVEPTPRPARANTSTDKPSELKRVTVSKKNQKASIPGATEIRYFNIKGDSPTKLLRQNQKKASRHCGDHRAIACVLMSWEFSAVKTFDPDTRKCIIGKATTTLRSTVYLPRWTTRAGASRDLVDWWHLVLVESAVHEAKHIKIQQRHLAKFRRAAAGKACGAATILFNRHSTKANKAQAAFDRIEYQKPLPLLPLSLPR